MSSDLIIGQRGARSRAGSTSSSLSSSSVSCSSSSSMSYSSASGASMPSLPSEATPPVPRREHRGDESPATDDRKGKKKKHKHRTHRRHAAHPTPEVLLYWGGSQGLTLDAALPLLPAKRVVQVNAGGRHFGMLTAAGHVYMMGDNSCGQLGLPNVRESNEPVRLKGALEHVRIALISCGLTQTAAVSNDGQLFLCGINVFGRGEKCDEMRKCQDFDRIGKVTSVVFGAYLTACLVRNVYKRSEVWVWGDGPLGLGDVKTSERPALIEDLAHEEVVQVSASDTHMAALASSGAVYLWGQNREGVLGLGSPDDEVSVPTLLAGVATLFTHVTCGSGYTLAVARDGHVYSWGRGSYGTLGCGAQKAQTPIPARVPGLQSVQGVDSSIAHCVAWTFDGDVYAWGKNDKCQLGFASADKKVFAPTKLEQLDDKNVVQMSCGSSFTVARIGRIFATVYLACPLKADGLSQQQPASEPASISVNLGKFPTPARIVEHLVEAQLLPQSDGYVLLDCYMMEQGPDELLRKTLEHKPQSVFFVVPKKNLYAIDQDDEFELLPPGIVSTLRTGLSSDSVPALAAASKKKGRAATTSPSPSPSPTSALGRSSPSLEPAVDTTAYPMVARGTLLRLVDWLTAARYTGDRFREVFFLSYKSWSICSMELFRMLVNRYQEDHREIVGEDVPGVALAIVDGLAYSAIKLRVLQVLAFWIQNYPNDFLCPDAQSTTLISKLVKFIETDVQPVFPPQAQRLQQLIVGHLDPLRVGDNTPSRRLKYYPEGADAPEPPLHSDAVDLFKYSPREIARQLTLVDFFDYFRRIDLAEFADQAWENKKELRAPNILRMIERFNNVSQWVAAEILKARTHQLRVRTTEVFIEVANECLKLGNFNSVMNIVSAFVTIPIHRLRSIWEPSTGSLKGISKQHSKILASLRLVCSQDANSSLLRQHMAAAPYPKLYFLGLYLRDIFMVDEGNKTFVDAERKIINFAKFVSYSRHVLELKQCQQNPYRIIPILELMEMLQSCRGFENHSESAYQLSCSIDGLSGQQLPVPSQLSIEDAYHFCDYRSDQRNEAFEVELLNSRSLVVLRNSSMFDRSKLWRTWIRDLRHGTKTDRFLEAILQSSVLEKSAVALVQQPPNTLEQNLVHELFSVVFAHLPPEVVQDLMAVLQYLSTCRLGEQHLEAVAALVKFLKPAPQQQQRLPGVHDAELADKRDQLNLSARSCRELFKLVAEAGAKPKLTELLSRIPDMMQLNQYFGALLDSLLAVETSASSSSWTRSERAGVQELVQYLRHLPAQTQDRIRAIEQQRSQLAEQSRENEARYGEEERAAQELMTGLVRRKEELERQLRAVNRSIRSQKKHIESIQEQGRRAKRKTSKAMIAAEQSLTLENSFLTKLSDSQSSRSLPPLQKFVQTYTQPMQEERERGRTLIRDYITATKEDFFYSATNLLDIEIAVAAAASQTLVEWHTRARNLLRDLVEAEQTPTLETLSSFLPVEKAQLKILEESRTRTHALHTAVIEKTRTTSKDSEPSSMSSSQDGAHLSSTAERCLGQINAQLAALDKIYNETINGLPSLSSLVQQDGALTDRQ